MAVETRELVFWTLFQGYMAYTIGRAGVTVVSRNLETEYGLGKADFGAILSAFSLVYGLSKFVGNLATDHVSPSSLFAGALCLAGVANFSFALLAPGLPGHWRGPALQLVWGINGGVQGFGWPALSAILLQWFPASRRGSVWGQLTTAGNMGQTLSPVVLAWVVSTTSDWRCALALPGLACMASALVSWTFLSDRPSEGRYRPAATLKKSRLDSSFWSAVATRWDFWALLFADALVYMVLRGLGAWSIAALAEDKGLGPAAAALGLTLYEAGGVVGTLMSGVLSDRIGGEGFRNCTSMICTSGLVVSIATLWALPEESSAALLYVAVASAGACVYGAKAMCGIAVRETHAEARGAAGGALGLAGQVGAAMGGLPVGTVASSRGWSAVFLLFVVSAFLSTLVFAALTAADVGRDRRKRE